MGDSVSKVLNSLIGTHINLSGVVLALRDRVCDVPNAEVPMPAFQAPHGLNRWSPSTKRLPSIHFAPYDSDAGTTPIRVTSFQKT